MTRRRLWHLFLLLLSLAAASRVAAAPPRQAEQDHFSYLPAVHGGEGSGEGNGAAGAAEEVVALVNEQRVEAGCPPLAIDARLVAAAQGHSEDMAHNDFFSHTGSDGSLPWDRMAAEGYNWSRAAENIAAGYPTPEQAVTAWMNSPGHRNNILNCDLVDTGVGHVYLADDRGDVNYGHYWTHVFGTPR